MQDEITSDLARLADLKVVGPQSACSYLPSRNAILAPSGAILERGTIAMVKLTTRNTGEISAQVEQSRRRGRSDEAEAKHAHLGTRAPCGTFDRLLEAPWGPK